MLNVIVRSNHRSVLKYYIYKRFITFVENGQSNKYNIIEELYYIYIFLITAIISYKRDRDDIVWALVTIVDRIRFRVSIIIWNEVPNRIEFIKYAWYEWSSRVREIRSPTGVGSTYKTMNGTHRSRIVMALRTIHNR